MIGCALWTDLFVAVAFIDLLVDFFIKLEKLVLKVSLLSLVKIVKLVPRVAWVILDLLSRFKTVFSGPNHILNLLYLRLNLLLPVACHSISPALSLSLLQRYCVDRVDRPCQEYKPWYVHVGKLFKATGVPEVERLVADFDQKEVVEGFLGLLANRYNLPTTLLLFYEVFNFRKVTELSVRRLI